MALSKMGFHTGPGGNKNGLGDWERALNGAGRPFGMKAADEYGPLHEAVQIGREHGIQNWLGFRLTRASGRVSREVPDYNVAPWEDAPRLCQEVLEKLPPEFDKSVWLEIINEPRAENKGEDTMFGNMNACNYLGEWCLAAAQFLNERGYKFMGPSFNAGEPGREGHTLQDAVTQYAQPGMLKYLRYCAGNPDKAALSVHEYSWSSWQEGQRPSDWYPGLWGRFEAAIAAADLNAIPRSFPIFVSEFGFAHREAPSGSDAWSFLDERNQMTARWPQLKYDAAWTLQEGWGGIDNDVNSWMQYDSGKQFEEGAQPARTHSFFGDTLPGAPAPSPGEAPPDIEVSSDSMTRIVTATARVNLRAEPSTTSTILAKLEPRTVVELLESGEWSHVRFNGITGFIRSDLLGEVNGSPAPVPTGGPFVYQGPSVQFFTGIHGPASDHVWQEPAFVTMMQQLAMPVLFMSHGINPDFAHLGDPARNIVRLFYNPNPQKTEPEAVYTEIRDDQLRRWWNRGYRRFIFFNEVNLPLGLGQSLEGRGILWHTPAEFAGFLRHCLQRARQEFPGIRLYTTPMTPAFEVWEWRQAMWERVRDLVSGYAMHAYSGNNNDADIAAREIANEAIELQRRLRLNVPLVITEASVNRGDNAQQKAQVAHRLPHHLGNVRGIEGVFWYAADWDPSFDEHHEGWFRKGIADAYLQQRGPGPFAQRPPMDTPLIGLPADDVQLLADEVPQSRGIILQHSFALYKAIRQDGYVAVGDECEVDVEEIRHVAQLAEHPDEERGPRVYVAIVPRWDEIRFVDDARHPPVTPADEMLFVEALSGRGVTLQRTHAIYKAIRRDGYVAVDNEFYLTAGDRVYAVQFAEHPDEVRIPRAYISLVPNWESVWWIGAPQRDPADLERAIVSLWSEGGFDPPVGTEEERRGTEVWPPRWSDATPYLKRYTFGDPPREAIHTGADLNLPGDADNNRPVYACAAGTVTFARLVGSSTWGRLVVIRHPLPDGRIVHSRYGHLRQLHVVEGEQVHRGQQLGTIGGDEYGVANHLHFDVSLSGKLQTDAIHWPGLDEQGVRDHYVEPAQFIRDHRPITAAGPMASPDIEAVDSEASLLFDAGLAPAVGRKVVTARAGLHLREAPDRTSRSLLLLKRDTEVEVLEEGRWDRVRLNNVVGYLPSAWLSSHRRRLPGHDVESLVSSGQTDKPDGVSDFLPSIQGDGFPHEGKSA
jgi:murein DD-endopeptidase MepM/ murein hydrolase activator NlpD